MRCKQTLPFNGAFAHVVRMSTLSAAPKQQGPSFLQEEGGDQWMLVAFGGICPDQVNVWCESVSSQTPPVVHDLRCSKVLCSRISMHKFTAY